MSFDRVVLHGGEGSLLAHDEVAHANLADIMKFRRSFEKEKKKILLHSNLLNSISRAIPTAY